MEEEAAFRSWRGASSLPWYIAGSQLLGVASVVITGVWMGHFRGGYAWDGSSQEFNVHPLCMVLAMIFLYGDGIVAVFQYHDANNIPHMYSLHSWCGMLTFVLFIAQWLLGFCFFLFPWTTTWLRSLYLPLHVFFGLSLFGLAVATCLLGIMEKLLFAISDTYSAYAPEGILANTLGIMLLAYGVLVGYVVTRDEFKRPPHPEEEALSVHFKTLTEGGAVSP
ncbi:transmembrane ascorbate-dependent reductase CYB561 isoform X2 [Alosa alosa]|uniref:transmembrane ascorbate-dependent reductase CYB561 isoform X2 n=1 Tax=Alosa sapidissima TaxID=34773 RepID=UPI001C099448|nr:transmembrane ascorbate-dependent reductase CYB561 isoform X2 [Alosa sapidissima]XP_048102422.1 transmembrane ascorbate-dependent reductase CYB561 isoform X2 [Alosa alosa]